MISLLYKTGKIKRRMFEIKILVEEFFSVLLFMFRPHLCHGSMEVVPDGMNLPNELEFGDSLQEPDKIGKYRKPFFFFTYFCY